MLMNLRTLLLAAALGLTWTGPLIAQPINTECPMLWHLAEITPHLDQLMRSADEKGEFEALLAFEKSLERMPPTLMTDIVIRGQLSPSLSRLTAYVRALQALRRAVAKGDGATIRDGARAPEIRAGADLVQQLLDEGGCRSVGQFVSSEGVKAAWAPIPTPQDGAVDTEEYLWKRATLRSVGLPALWAVVLLAVALATVNWIGPILCKRPQFARRSRRYSGRFRTRIVHDGKARTSLIIDASRDGCQINSPPKARTGDPVTVQICGEPISAQVIWSRGRSAGLRFAAQLDDAQLAAIKSSFSEDLSH